MHLQLLHQPAGAHPLPPDTVVWRTCLREVAFVTDGATAGGRPPIAGGEAYALLVEIVSGLRSPLVGETEVQAQFKQFLDSLDPSTHRSLHRLGQRILRDARSIRRRFLQGFGAHSYGRLATRHLPEGARVVVVGTGALATEVLAALPASAVVDQWGRSTASRPSSERRAASGPAATHFYLFSPPEGSVRQKPTADPAALVIAAPVSARDLAIVLSGYQRLLAAVDLRPAVDRTPLPAAVPVTTLDDLFAQAGTSDDPTVALRLTAARAEVRDLGQAYEHQEELRPFGWDDLCA